MGKDIKSALQKARKMIQADAKADSHILRERAADRNNPAFFRDQPNDAFSQITSVNGFDNSSQINESGYDYSDDRLDEAFNSMGSSNVTKSGYDLASLQVSQEQAMASKLPKAVIESLATHPIDQTKLDKEYTQLNELKRELALEKEKNQKQKQVVRETIAPSNVQGGIDYSLIKTIVEECVRKYSGAIVKNVLNESKGSDGDSIKMLKLGEGFTFVTSSGDVYEAKLKFKKNIKKEQ